MPVTKTYVCPRSARARYCKKVVKSDRWVRTHCVRGTIRTTAVRGSAGYLKRTCRLRKRGPRGGRTAVLSLLKPKGQ